MYINSIGKYVPEARITNDYFEKLNNLEEGWILQRTGMVSRSKAASDENADTMAINAIDDAIKNLPYDIKEVNLIVGAFYAAYDTVATPAHVAQRHYGIHGAKAVYASAACSSFINGLEIVEGYFA
ncbi:MAG: ketoacyl-ACP synthase III, partial [Muribaculaceae bacterium]|nr:ketoacyl-ACP synthase III [Muribaculaceae bacterium]